ncbi:MAG: hypothetical protein HY735_22820 [Verrucomicrobia bacterium]|nr:hypothetical protein [Verrucomicrobiota bacterium]
MNIVFAAALDLQAVCQREGWHFCFIGGIAVQRWGRPRFTDDVDLTLLTGFGGEQEFIKKLLQHYAPRRPDTFEFAVRNRVLLIQTHSGVGMDVAMGALPFEERTLHRASPFVFPNQTSLITCCAEDLIVHKCFANRDIDWLDVDNILARQHGKLNLALVREELKPLLLLKEQPEILDKLERRIAHHDQPFTRIKPARRRP